MLQQEAGRQHSQQPTLIETEAGIGYRFIGS
ncbi:hypothetical protein J2S82_000624 [Aeromonas caviae]|jgi:hypothetical protein|nr:hypothetical protein [Aeromonas caviae]BBG87348.1 hypothetical protein ACGSH8M1_000140 [Aeromonas caviae]BBT51051.1 hypothetical protein WP8S18C01_00140 [Aeromonas caviae]